MTQCKNTLRKVRNICAEAWLKEPMRPNVPQPSAHQQVGKGLSKGHKAFPTAAESSAQGDGKSSEDIDDMSEIETQQEQERITDLVNITKRMNYLARKKAELQGPI